MLLLLKQGENEDEASKRDTRVEQEGAEVREKSATNNAGDRFSSGGGAGWASLGKGPGSTRGAGAAEHVKGCRCCFPPDQVSVGIVTCAHACACACSSWAFEMTFLIGRRRCLLACSPPEPNVVPFRPRVPPSPLSPCSLISLHGPCLLRNDSNKDVRRCLSSNSCTQLERHRQHAGFRATVCGCGVLLPCEHQSSHALRSCFLFTCSWSRGTALELQHDTARKQDAAQHA